MRNLRVRKKSQENSIPLWRIAQALGVSEATMTRRLRIELPEEEQARLCSIIDELAGGGS